jgi:hypothetical protein
MKLFLIKGLVVALLLLPFALVGQAAEFLLFYANDVQGELDPCG